MLYCPFPIFMLPGRGPHNRRPDAARWRGTRTASGKAPRVLQDRLFGLRIEDPYFGRVDHQAYLLPLTRRALRRDAGDHQVAAYILGRPSHGVLLGAALVVVCHRGDARQANGLIPGRLEVDVLLGPHALYDLRLDVHAARALRPAEDLGRLGLGVLQVLGPDAEHDLAEVLAEVFAPPLLDLSHHLGAQGYAGAAKGDRVAAVLPLQARPEEVHRRGSYKARHEDVVRMVVHLLRRVHLLHEAVFQDHDAVRHRHGLGLVVGDVDGGGADPVVQLGDLRPHLHPELGVEVGEGLVHEEGLRLPHDGPPERHPLPLAAGEGLRLPVQEVLDGEDARGLLDPLVDLGLLHLAELEREAHVLAHVHVRVEGVVLEDHRYVPLAGRQVVHHPVPDKDLAPAYVLEPRYHAQGRGLAAPRRPDEDHKLSVGYVEVHLVHGGDVATVDLGDLFHGHFGHAISSFRSAERSSPRAPWRSRTAS